jgi:high-affinity Fe2+/Pb2+ permease
MPNYQNGKIYKLVNDIDDKIYIGSTVSTLAKRKGQHKGKRESNPKNKHLNEIGWDTVVIVLIELYPCNSKDELHARERYWIDELKPELNKQIPLRTLKEWRTDNKEKIQENNKQYIIDNKEKIQENSKQYYIDNKEKIVLHTQQYYIDNKENIQIYKKQYYIDNKEKGNEEVNCECGFIVKKRNIVRHKTTHKHISSIKC